MAGRTRDQEISSSLWVWLPAGALPRSNQLSIPLGYVNRVPAYWLELKWSTFTCVGWQVTLHDPIWQVTSRSCEVGVPLTAINISLTFLPSVPTLPPNSGYTTGQTLPFLAKCEAYSCLMVVIDVIIITIVIHISGCRALSSVSRSLLQSCNSSLYSNQTGWSFQALIQSCFIYLHTWWGYDCFQYAFHLFTTRQKNILFSVAALMTEYCWSVPVICTDG